MHKLSRRGFMASGVAAGLGATPLMAQPAFPNRPITFVVPFSAGGGGDTVARLVGKALSARVGVPVVVENRPGAGGNIGAAHALKSKADGYTLLNMSSTYGIQAALAKLPFDPLADMQPVIMVSRDPIVVLARQDSPLTDARALTMAGKAQPGKITYGSAGTGSIAHLGMVELGLALGIDMQHIPYKGSSQAFSDLMAGTIHVMLTSTNFAAAQVRSGRLRGLGVAGESRHPNLPNVPTFAEQGYPDYRVHDWKAIGAPHGVPETIVQTLNRELNAVLAMPEIVARFANDGSRVVGGSPAHMMDILRADIDHWRIIAKHGNVQLA